MTVRHARVYSEGAGGDYRVEAEGEVWEGLSLEEMKALIERERLMADWYHDGAWRALWSL